MNQSLDPITISIRAKPLGLSLNEGLGFSGVTGWQ